ncbi:MAG: integrase family protein [Rhodospirillales bacterium]|nr:integrase family protein [Rhodospirillales bacterium]MCB9996249.1 integrase family protein [Rhodospirillales bacterium]
MPVLKITKTAIDKIPYTKQGQEIFFDTELKGFGVVVGKKSKTYIVQSYVGNQRVRFRIGRHGVFSPEQARGQAIQHLADMSRGVNPVEKQAGLRANNLTVSEMLEEYIRDRKSLRPSTAKAYRSHVRLYIPDWTDKPLVSLKKNDILERHRKIGKEKGEAAANKTMRVLRQLFNYSHAIYNNAPDNPVRYLTLLKAWFPAVRRKSYIKPNDLAAWYWGVQQLVNPVARDLFVLLLFTGLRRSEALKLKWVNVDMDDRTFTIPITKNNDAHTLPMSGFLYDFFRRRKEACGLSEWVFPGHGDHGHLTEPKKCVAFVKRISGIEFCIHDLRRTFITIAESEDIPHYALKKLLNHRSGDITSTYIMIDAERLRGPMEKVSKRIEELIKK